MRGLLEGDGGTEEGRETPAEEAILPTGQCSEATEQGEAGLQRNRGNISRAAFEIGVSRHTLHALIRQT